MALTTTCSFLFAANFNISRNGEDYLSTKIPYGCYHKDMHSGVFELSFSVKSFNIAHIAADSAMFTGSKENSCV